MGRRQAPNASGYDPTRTLFGLTLRRDVEGKPFTEFANGDTLPLMYHRRTGCFGRTYRGDWSYDFPSLPERFQSWAKAKPPPFPSPQEVRDKIGIVDKVDHDRLRTPPCGPTRVQATWMGHASFLVQVGGVNILTDPVWSTRCAPTQILGPERYAQPPVRVSDLPHIDIVTISHNHYDHLDRLTVMALREAFQPTFVVPKGMKEWFLTYRWQPTAAERAAGISKPLESKIVELDWWQPAWVRPTAPSMPGLPSVLITLVPVQHWSMRTGPWDRDLELWGGYVYEVDVNRIDPTVGTAHCAATDERRVVRRFFHSGDTGYQDRLFKQIGRVFGKHFDLAMLPIGAYNPRWFLRVQHVDPEEAVKIHVDLGRPALSLGMHWGTFILTDEPIDEPPKLLRAALAQSHLPESEFVPLKHGESVVAPLPDAGASDRHEGLSRDREPMALSPPSAAVVARDFLSVALAE